MRDNLCDEKKLIDVISFGTEFIQEDKQDIRQVYADLENNIYKYAVAPEEYIKRTAGSILRETRNIIRATYSLGEQCKEVESIFIENFEYIPVVGYADAYVNMLHYITLGIIFEIPKADMQKLVDIIDEAKVDDLLFDFFINAYGLERKIKSTKLQEKKPYFRVMEIVEIAKNDKEAASKMLANYVENEWLKGHAAYEWPTMHKKVYYYGLWSFESAALAKILGLDDESLKDDNHYPYDLAHYKNGMDFSDVQWNYSVKEETENYVEGIAANTTLETIIPKKYHQCVSQVIADYNSLDDKAFWEKYGLDQVWFHLEEFSDDKKDGLLGTLIVFELIKQGYILQLDYKEDLEDYVDFMENYWGQEDTKLIEFILDDDQQYYAKVPRNTKLVDIYEVKVAEV